MEDKTRRLLVALELLALVVSALLILVDYKLKQDLLKLFERIESTLETGNGLHPQNPDDRAGAGRVPGRGLVGDMPGVETSANASPPSANGSGKARASRGKAADGDGRTRGAEVSKPGQQVGP